jgi:hypothetical protein
MKRTIIILSAVLSSGYCFAQAIPSNPRAIELSLSGPAPSYNDHLPQGSPGMATVQAVNAGYGGNMPVNSFYITVSIDESKMQFDASGNTSIFDTTANGGKWRIVTLAPGWIKLRNTNGVIAPNESMYFEFKFTILPNALVSDADAALDVGLSNGFSSQASNTINTTEDDYMEASIPIIAAAPLPVTLSSFTAAKAGSNSLLNWSTASEVNNDHFDVERSANGKNFGKIGVVKGSGTTNEIRKYIFSDGHTLPGINYYRLKQTDVDGKSVYSKIESVTFGDVSDIAFFPNPVNDQLMVNGLKGGEQIVVYNTLGQQLGMTTVTGTMTYFSFGHLPAGSYRVVVLKDGERIASKQIVKN